LAGMFVMVPPVVFLVMVGVIVLVPVVYSYVAYKRVEGFEEEG
jgi:hypothetical protein